MPLESANWVLTLGYVSGLIAIISSVYYSWKRSLFAPMRQATVGAKAKAAAGLRRTLKWHEVFGLVALAAAGFHVVNSWPKLKLSVSWLATGMMVVVLSGTFMCPILFSFSWCS